MDESQTSSLEGVLERIVYANEDNAWSVVRHTLWGGRAAGQAVGNRHGVQPGESLRLEGEWIVDRKYGEQFRVESYRTLKPATLVGIEKYLGSGLVRGIGPVMARRLVERFAQDTLDVIDHQPERLGEVEGIGPVRSAAIRKAWIEQREVRELMVFLQSHGVSTTFAAKIWKAYQDQAIAVVREDPYRLALDIYGIGFRTADRIALSLGIPPTAPRRSQAAVLHVLGALSDEGHVYYPRAPLAEQTTRLLEVEGTLVEEAMSALALERRLVVERLPGDLGEAIYLPALHLAEMGAAARVESLVSAPALPIKLDVERALEWFEHRGRIELAGEQRQAIRRAITSKVLVVTGGPGTGKTTLVDALVQILTKKGRRILLAAPTGRAARRLAELTAHDAKTLHRLLEFNPKSGAFERNPNRLLEADLLVVDEVSMVDAVLFYHLLKAVPAHCQLVLVGDVDQLPSVGPGNVLRDLIRSGAVDVVRLTEIFRQDRESLIVTNAHRVNRGELPVLKPEGESPDFFFIEREDPEEVLGEIRTLVAERIPRRFGLDPTVDIQVLTPMHKGILGAVNLNAELGTLLNLRTESVTRGNRIFRLGDKVMQIRNNYQLDVFNGDIGRIAALSEVDREVRIRFEDRTVTYDFTDLDELVLAYACSIHKSQGSEYPCVVIPLHTQHYVMLQRNLLYTGITRGRKLVVLVGNRKALSLAVQNNRIEERFTRLAERLRPLPSGPISDAVDAGKST